MAKKCIIRIQREKEKKISLNLPGSTTRRTIQLPINFDPLSMIGKAKKMNGKFFFVNDVSYEAR